MNVALVCAASELVPAARDWLAAKPAPEFAALVVNCGLAAFGLTGPPSAPTRAAAAPAAPLEVGSSRRGAAAEESVAAVLGARYTLSDTAKTAHGADFAIETPAGPILVEVKDYSAPVPRKEVLKLGADIAARGAVAAVFLSLNSPIATIAESLAIRFESAGGPRVPVVYAAPGAAATASAATPSASASAAPAARMPPAVMLVATEIAVGLARAAAALRIDARARDDVVGRLAAIRSLLDELGSARTTLREAAAAVSAALSECAERLASTEGRLRAAVTDLLADIDHEAVSVPAGEILAALQARYSGLDASGVAAAVDALAARLLAATPPDALDRLKEWRFLKTKAVHASGWGFSFTRGTTSLILPRDCANSCGATDAAFMQLLLDHPAQVRCINGVLEVALAPDAAAAVISIL